MLPKPYYFYTLKDEFFDDFPDPYLKNNKNQKRPFYYCFKDSNEIFWFIPCTSRVDKYNKMIEAAQKKNKPADKWHKIFLCGKENILLIQDVFPVTEKYINREFLKNNIHQRIASKTEQKIIRQKANKIIALTKYKGKLFSTQADIMKIKEKLQNQS